MNIKPNIIIVLFPSYSLLYFTAAAVPTVSSISCSFTPVHLLIIHRHAVTCISSSLDWMSGGKSAAPQVNGSNGSAPNRSLPEEKKGSLFPFILQATEANIHKIWAYATWSYGRTNQHSSTFDKEMNKKRQLTHFCRPCRGWRGWAITCW